VDIENLPEPEQVRLAPILDAYEEQNKRKYAEKIQRLKKALDFLSRYEAGETLLDSFFPTKLYIDKPTLDDIRDNFSLDSVVGEVLSISDEENNLKRDIARHENLRHELHPWLALTEPIAGLKDTETCRVKAGLISEEHYLLLKERVTALQPVVLRHISAVGKDHFILLVYHLAVEAQIKEIFAGISFIEHIFSTELQDAPQKEYQRYQEKLSRLYARLRKIDENGKALARQADKLRVMYDVLAKDRDIYVVQDQLKGTDSTFFITGWIKESDVAAFQQAMDYYKDALHIEIADPPDTDSVPVALKTPKWLKPFKMVLTLYALPRYLEVDPTVVMAPFFALFFALCLTDAGYGLLLTALAFYLYKTRKVAKGGDLLYKLMMIVGGLTIVAGVLTGGFFGYSLSGVPVLNKLVILDLNAESTPSGESPSIVFLKFALLMGIIHVIVGIGVKGYMKIREGHLFDALIDELNQILLIAAGSVVVGNFLGFIEDVPPLVGRVALYVMAATSLVFVLFIGRELKKIPGRIGKGLFEFYSFFSGIFGDILSYSRLMALGLATGVIARSVDMIVKMLFDIKILGPLLGILLFILGHLFMMLINALGSFIHTARLQYLEFFQKFFEGGGRAFQPFKHEKKYIIYDKDVA